MAHCFLALLSITISALTAHAATEISWQRHQLATEFFAEGATAADIDKDGQVDIVSGPYWYAGPDWQTKHAFYEPEVFSINGYSDNFFAYAHDLTGDGWLDVLVIGFPGKEARLYVSPGKFDKDVPWAMHVVADVVDNESPVFTDTTGDGKPEIVCSTAGRFGWFSPNWDRPTEKWVFNAVTEDMKVAKFTHGLGIGDVDGDGKLDLLEARRWWQNTKEKFVQHNFAAGVGGGAQMFAYDFDGNGTNDVFTSLAAHRYGVAVYLQNKAAPDQPTWQRVMLASENPADNDYGIVFSQPHAAALADINGDGVQDIVTGKRYWAHNGHDPDERGPRVVYWYETHRDGKGAVDFIPHLIDANSGVGVDVQVHDVNGDRLPDIVVGNKAGVYVLTQHRREVAALPAPVKLYGEGLKAQKDYAQGQSAEAALKAMQLPTGFRAELVASEPDLVQPIAFTFDERGRIWVVEGLSYPQPREVGQGKDRIKILEDKDGDGRYETVKIFCEGISLASGIEVGFGGVWVGAAPYFMFIADRDRDDRPDATAVAHPVPGLSFQAEILLDGWGTQDTHETLNSFIWGPDGWLYGCHGVFTHSLIGKPSSAAKGRTPMNAGVWRYHPTRHEFEVYAHGTSNPWGLDYDATGEFFVTACVIPHLYHIVPGGRYQRQGGQHFNPYTYADIKTIADHAHYAGNIRDNAHWGERDAGAIVQNDTNAAGGGHAHCGLAIYQSGQFPDEYRGRLIFGNLHGHRLVTDYVDAHGSSFVGKHGSDFMRSNDMHFIPVTQRVGPDGCLYVSDWSDKQVCHRGSGAVEIWDRSNGRMYRVRHGAAAVKAQDLSKMTGTDLAKLAVNSDDAWASRMARRLLTEQAAKLRDGVMKAQEGFVERSQDSVRSTQPGFAEGLIIWAQVYGWQTPAHQARALWLLQCLGIPGANMIVQDIAPGLVTNPALAVRLMESSNLAGMLKTLKESAAPATRRELASKLQTMKPGDRRKLAAALIGHGEDKDDPYIPLLIWYGIEPLVGADPKAGLELAKVSKLPQVTEFIYRRMSAEEVGRSGLLDLAASTDDAELRASFLKTVLLAARAGNKIVQPASWSALKQKVAAGDSTVRELDAFMGNKAAKAAFRAQLMDASMTMTQREAALALLTHVRDAETSALLVQLISDKDMPLRRKAVQALATLPHADAPALLVGSYASLDPGTQTDAVNTLATTGAGATALLQAVKAKSIPTTALSPFLARQIAALNQPSIGVLLKETFGDINAPKADLGERRAKLKALLTPALLAKADQAKGKVLFSAVCGQCHQMFGEGQKVGPDLTGSNRADIDYLLDNVLDPNAVIGKTYQLNLFELNDGRVASGVVMEESSTAYRVAMPGGLEQVIPASEVKKRSVSKASTMPEGLFDSLPPELLQQLVAYLQSNVQVNAKAALKVDGAIEGEALRVTAITGGKTKPQGMAGFGGKWSGGQQLWWTGAKPGSSLTLALPVAKSGMYTLKAVLTMARDYGIMDVSLDGKSVVKGFDGYNLPAVIVSGPLDWGTHDLAAGDHQLTFTITGANPAAAPGYMVGLDYLKLE
jgi:putative membrane-bound dehydrogenase-like protein